MPLSDIEFRKIRQYACRPCETVTAAPIPPAVIDGSMAALSLLAWVASSKYLDHLPLYRIEPIGARWASSTPCLPWQSCTPWLLASRNTVAAGSGTAKAIKHALKRWHALQRYARSGSMPIDNNPVENVIRPIAIGKKN